jgi:hypothetical protein
MSGHSIEKVSLTRSHPSGVAFSDYALKQLKQEVINSYFETLLARGDVSMLVSKEEVGNVVQVKVSIRENLYV